MSARDPGRTAYEARFHDSRPSYFDPWEKLTPEVKAIWRNVASACRAPVIAEAAEAQAERAEICRELGCVDKPGVPLRFVRDLREQVSQANARVSETIRMWDPAAPTERQELDRLRRGWGPSTPTERERRRSDVAACIQAISIAMSDVMASEEDASGLPKEALDRLDEAHERLANVHATLIEVSNGIRTDPAEWPDIKTAEERGAAAAREEADRAGSDYADAMNARMEDALVIENLRIAFLVAAGSGHGGGMSVVRKWFAAGATGPIPWAPGALFAAWAAKHDIYDCNGAMGFRRREAGVEQLGGGSAA